MVSVAVDAKGALTPVIAEAVQEDFGRQGFAVCEALLNASAQQVLIDAAYGWEQIKDGNYTPLMHPHRASTAFMEALCHPTIVSVMETVLGGRVSALQSQFFFCKPGTKGFSCHQDNFYVRSGKESFASIWIALCDVTPENGGLFFFPGTHNEPILKVRETQIVQAGHQDKNANRIECVVPDQYLPLKADQPLAAGAAAVFHGHTVHGSHDNVSSRWRPSLLLTYVREGADFRPGTYSQRRAVDVYAGAELPND